MTKQKQGYHWNYWQGQDESKRGEDRLWTAPYMFYWWLLPSVCLVGQWADNGLCWTTEKLMAACVESVCVLIANSCPPQIQLKEPCHHCAGYHIRSSFTRATAGSQPEMTCAVRPHDHTMTTRHTRWRAFNFVCFFSIPPELSTFCQRRVVCFIIWIFQYGCPSWHNILG